MTTSLYSPAHTGQAGSQDLSPDELVARAVDLRPRLRKLQSEHEQLGGYSREIHQEFLDAGFYRILQPRKYGGLEYGLDDFIRVGVEISRGDPGVGWSFILGAGHAFHVGSFFGEKAQEELFGQGAFIGPGRTIPAGKAVATDGGYRLTGTWDYCSGSMWSTHVLVVAPTFSADEDQLGLQMFAVPRPDYTVLDDWGGDRTIGLRASSSNSVKIEDAFVPAHLAVPYDFREHELGSHGTPGYQLHKNPMYLGRTMTFFNAELVATQIGAAWAAVDEFEQLMESRAASFPPRLPRLAAPEYHRWFGQLLALADSAECLLLAGVRQYAELGQRWQATGEEFTPEQDARLRGVVQQAAQLAIQAVEIAFTTAGSSSAKSGSPMEKYYRDVAMYKTHIAAQWDVTFGAVSRFHFGQPLTF
ncbi:acyl-CoA dehydrogenase family protein [Arthrobacter sp. KN11-1C]|uniref:acyl-CoA dehydrogenase family protein n=1 Tax=Arthrobacter sp. KN11-1C TaxID=3445774 RepID=UPI003F9F3C82